MFFVCKSLTSPVAARIVLWLIFLLVQVMLFAPLGSGPTVDRPPFLNDTPSSQQFLEKGSWEKQRTAPKFQQQHSDRATGDATFNDIDVYYKKNNGMLQSSTNCIERGMKDPAAHANYSWMFRSCHFHQLCINTESNEFLMASPKGVSEDPGEQEELALGSINPRWSGRGFNKGFHKVKWHPRRVDSETILGYYELPSNVVLVPFHSMAAHNVGHLLWDDFYPLFTLLSLFGFTPKKGNSFQYLPLRWASPEGKLYATCEMQKKKIKICNDNRQRFLPLLGVNPDTFSTVKKAELKVTSQQSQLKSPYVCSKQAVAGIGMLMDHGARDHGWLLRDPDSGHNLAPHNIGRGRMFHKFRNFLVQNMGFPPGIPPPSIRDKITFSTFSSRGFERSLGFENQSAIVRRALAESRRPQFKVQCITMKEASLEEQIQIALESAIFVTVSGGGAVTATFLPPGSTLIVYYLEDGGYDFWNGPVGNYTYTPARLDWDLLSNAAHLKVHWLPIKSMESTQDLKILEQLVLHELQATDGWSGL